MTLRRIIYAFGILTILTATSCVNTQNEEKVEEAPKHLLINLTSDATVNAHGSMMGLHFAEKALKNNIKVTVFMNVDGVKLLRPGADTIVFDGENIRALLDKVAEEGGELIACPHCMMIHGLEKSDLPDNVTFGEESVVMGKIKEGPTVFTY
jgi:predicted peroxiredoxin